MGMGGRSAGMKIEILATIEAPARGKHGAFCAGVVIWGDGDEGRVVESADIVKFMRRWTRARVRAYCNAKGWKVTVISRTERA